MREQKLFFKTKSGARLSGIFRYPEKKTEKIVILCPGFTGTMNQFPFKGFPEFLSRNGYASFRFDFFGHGDSGGKLSKFTLEEELENLSAAMSLVSKRFRKIGMVGHSLGGLTVLAQANKSKAVVLFAPALMVRDIFLYVFSISEIWSKTSSIVESLKRRGFVKLPVKGWGRDKNKKPFTIGLRFWNSIEKFNSVKNLRQVHVPSLLVQAGDDGSMAIDLNRRAFRYMRCKKKFIFVKGANHIFSKHQKQIFKMAVDWFNKFL